MRKWMKVGGKLGGWVVRLSGGQVYSDARVLLC